MKSYKCKISSTDCAKHSHNGRHTKHLCTTIAARHQYRYGDIYRCIEDFQKGAKYHFEMKPTRYFYKCMQS